MGRDLTKDEKNAIKAAKAIEEFEKFQKEEDELEEQSKPRKPSGTKKKDRGGMVGRQRIRRSIASSTALTGVPTEVTQEHVRNIVNLEYSGKSDDEIAPLVGLSINTIRQYRSKFAIAFEEARTIHMAEASRQYHMNLMRVKAAASGAGPRCVEILMEIAEDPTVYPGVRRGAANDLLKLIGANEKVMLDDKRKRDFIEAVARNNAEESNAESYIIDAKIVEVSPEIGIDE